MRSNLLKNEIYLIVYRLYLARSRVKQIKLDVHAMTLECQMFEHDIINIGEDALRRDPLFNFDDYLKSFRRNRRLLYDLNNDLEKAIKEHEYWKKQEQMYYRKKRKKM